jgi:hypothetical protein
MGSMEIRSQNELTSFGFAKDYDAIVTVRTDIGERRFALEYERTPKPAKCYRAIATCMSQEVHVNRLLYLVANYDILRFVSGFFTKAVYPVFFGLLTDWHSNLLEMPVLDGLGKRAFPLRRHTESRGHVDCDQPPFALSMTFLWTLIDWPLALLVACKS